MILHALVEELEVARKAVEGGATVVQLRLKNLSTRELVSRGCAFRELCAGSGTTFVVNDDVDAAIELGADGVHLGAGDEGAERAREAGLLLGLSAQTLADALAAEAERPAYIGAGPVWPTPTKPQAAALGLDGLAEICVAVQTPVIAIGGIDVTNAARCLVAGAAGIAVVRAASEAAPLSAALRHAAV
jgi:thiamine-phosphate pyrophosphorylase